MLLVSDFVKAIASKKAKEAPVDPAPFPPNLVGNPSTDVVRREFRHLMWPSARRGSADLHNRSAHSVQRR
jgi:hypothetical protein